MSQISGAISDPKISAVPERSRRRRGELGPTSIRSSHSFSSNICRILEANGAAGGPPYAITFESLCIETQQVSTKR